MKFQKKFYFLITIFMLLVFSSSSIWAVYPETLLVLDMRNSMEFPKHFRSTSDILKKNEGINTINMKDLHIAGSGQFSKLSLEKVLQHLRVKYLTIIDLRQESHGFLNGNSISWYGRFNDANAHKKPEEIEKIQKELLDELNTKNEVAVDKILEKQNESIEKFSPIEFAVHQVSSEEDLARTLQLGYERIYIQDHHAPSKTEVDRFIQIVKTLPKDNWIYFHCRGGSGRTTTMMTMYDMIYNAKSLSFEDILKRQEALGGSDLTQLPNKNRYLYKASSKRLNFLKEFYRYAHENQDDFTTTWTEWLANKNHGT